jgi:hypothetical protein
MNDLDDLEQLLQEAVSEARRRRSSNREKDETHLDYAKRLAERGIYRRLSREANAALDASRFEFWFSSQADGMTLDQWRVYIDTLMAKKRRAMG